MYTCILLHVFRGHLFFLQIPPKESQSAAALVGVVLYILREFERLWINMLRYVTLSTCCSSLSPLVGMIWWVGFLIGYCHVTLLHFKFNHLRSSPCIQRIKLSLELDLMLDNPDSSINQAAVSKEAHLSMGLHYRREVFDEQKEK